ncbi:HNH endonuclease [Microbacterium sp. M28]|uniref:HNH endonuclease n=1 Tax=Microbacterium sp. M28 TaxID=2962064 RepID=UPI0021F406D7|nr:HNH endonuclease signature motif containing protein [Microbacterium sp. M28]UYO97283.1 HNH endonuclease [Microbacterium sp. M28]
MSPHLTPLHEALAVLAEVWGAAGDATDLSRAQLVAVNDALGVLERRTSAVHAEVAAGIAYESRAELGPEALAKQHGFRSPAKLIAASRGGSTGDATRLVKVGEATAPRVNLIGERLPAAYPAVRDALAVGAIGDQVAGMIISVLERTRCAAGAERVAAAERLLVEKAPGLSTDDVRRITARVEAWLDPDGVQPREEEIRGRRSLRLWERDGELHLELVTDVASGAPVKAALRGYVSAAFAARKDAVDADGADADRRSVEQLQADAFSLFCQHASECDRSHMPLAGAKVIVRVNLEDLTSGTGAGRIDGSDQPVSIAAVRRMAADGEIIPWVLGGGGEILDWGRGRRLFTKVQKLALAERDGGCAMCALPAEMTKVHHIDWWERDGGRTDLANGILLCETCHHRIHDNGWEIRIDGGGVAARVWFIPPPYVDPMRTPRLGGRARFDVVVAAA